MNFDWSKRKFNSELNGITFHFIYCYAHIKYISFVADIVSTLLLYTVSLYNILNFITFV